MLYYISIIKGHDSIFLLLMMMIPFWCPCCHLLYSLLFILSYLPFIKIFIIIFEWSWFNNVGRPMGIERDIIFYVRRQKKRIFSSPFKFEKSNGLNLKTPPSVNYLKMQAILPLNHNSQNLFIFCLFPIFKAFNLRLHVVSFRQDRTFISSASTRASYPSIARAKHHNEQTSQTIIILCLSSENQNNHYLKPVSIFISTISFPFKRIRT